MDSPLQVCLFQHLAVRHSVLPSDAEDLLKTSLMEGLQASEMVAVDGASQL